MGERPLTAPLVGPGMLGLVTLTLALHAGTAEALEGPAPSSPPQSMRLRVEDCEPPALGSAAALAALSLELSSDGVLGLGEGRGDLNPNPEAELRIKISCGALIEGHVVLERRDNGHSAFARVGLSDVELAQRPRALALLAAELVRSHWSVLAERDAGETLQSASVQNPPTKSFDSPPIPPPTAPPVLPAISPPKPTTIASVPPIDAHMRPRDLPTVPDSPQPMTLSVSVNGLTRYFVAYESLHLGGALEAAALPWSVEAQGLLSNRRDQLGEVSNGLVSFGGGWSPELWSDGNLSLRFGPRSAVGVTWATAAATDAPRTSATDAVTLYADVAARGQLALRLADWITKVSLEGGAARGIAARANERVVSATGGWFFSVALGIGR